MRYILCTSAVLSLALHATVLSTRISLVTREWKVNGPVRHVASSMQARTIIVLPSLPPPLPVHGSLPANETSHASGRAPILKEELSARAQPLAPLVSVTLEVETDSYIPRNQLSTPPVPKTTIVLEPPLGELTNDRLVGILSLFIDEQGRVQRVDAEEPTLPPAFEQAAREAFMAAEFSSGKVDGLAVKSRMRVEVVFESMSPSR